uniref:uncharacterized protein LOC122581456 n=1 Tax=Erigeron canadensis TaxID=72917 RepID=UPI001CB8ED19|nr:uncharacterized protein LOC122581456 [Erigeron canadensis]
MSISGPWKHICKIFNYFKSVGLELHEIFHVAPGLNSELTFWFDSWVGFDLLYKMFPNLFMLEVSKMCLLKDRVSWINGDQHVQFHWTRQLRPVEHAEVNNLLLLVAFVVWVEGKDSWRSDVCDSGRFSVKALRSKIKRSSGEQQNASFIWSRWVPIKANFLAWRLWIGRLPTKDNLAKRNVQVISMECGVCSLEEESVEHLFGSCQLAVQIWEHVSKWCRVHPFFFFSAKDLPSLAQQLIGDVGWKQPVHLVILTSIWCIWKNMNNIVFNSTGRVLWV